MALWCQSVERLCQETAIQWLVDNKDIPLDEIVPCQDELMILKEYHYPEILDDLTRINVERFDIRVE